MIKDEVTQQTKIKIMTLNNNDLITVRMHCVENLYLSFCPMWFECCAGMENGNFLFLLIVVKSHNYNNLPETSHCNDLFFFSFWNKHRCRCHFKKGIFQFLWMHTSDTKKNQESEQSTANRTEERNEKKPTYRTPRCRGARPQHLTE